MGGESRVGFAEVGFFLDGVEMLDFYGMAFVVLLATVETSAIAFCCWLYVRERARTDRLATLLFTSADCARREERSTLASASAVHEQSLMQVIQALQVQESNRLEYEKSQPRC